MVTVISWWALDSCCYFLFLGGFWMVTVVSYCVLDGYHVSLWTMDGYRYFCTTQTLAPCTHHARYSLKITMTTINRGGGGCLPGALLFYYLSQLQPQIYPLMEKPWSELTWLGTRCTAHLPYTARLAGNSCEFNNSKCHLYSSLNKH